MSFIEFPIVKKNFLNKKNIKFGNNQLKNSHYTNDSYKSFSIHNMNLFITNTLFLLNVEICFYEYKKIDLEILRKSFYFIEKLKLHNQKIIERQENIK